jgi:hypothetical protein
MGALTAAQQGALGCLLLGALTAVAGFLSSDILTQSTLVGEVGIGLVSLLTLLCLVAAWRLWLGKGAYLAITVLVIGLFLFAMTLMIKPQSFEFVVIGLLLLPVLQGVRGALALRNPAVADTVPGNS